MCVGMNGDTLDPGMRSASTSNRNFVGRQGPGARTHADEPGHGRRRRGDRPVDRRKGTFLDAAGRETDMEPFTSLTATAAPFDEVNVDTDQIIPSRLMRKPREDEKYHTFLFHDLRYDEDGSEKPDFILNRVTLPRGAHPRGRPQLRLRIVARGGGFRPHGQPASVRRDRVELRRHFLQQLLQ